MMSTISSLIEPIRWGAGVPAAPSGGVGACEDGAGGACAASGGDSADQATSRITISRIFAPLKNEDNTRTHVASSDRPMARRDAGQHRPARIAVDVPARRIDSRLGAHRLCRL